MAQKKRANYAEIFFGSANFLVELVLYVLVGVISTSKVDHANAETHLVHSAWGL